jgi:hypothetical protein
MLKDLQAQEYVEPRLMLGKVSYAQRGITQCLSHAQDLLADIGDGQLTRVRPYHISVSPTITAAEIENAAS